MSTFKEPTTESEPTSTHPAWLKRILRYTPQLPQRLKHLLDTVTTYLPQGLTQHLLKRPVTTPIILPLEGTVVFADIDGFTALTERFSQDESQSGAEEVTELVNRFLHLLIEAALPYGGDLHKFGGDAGLLLFTGTQHAQRAIAAALETQRAMQAMDEVETSLGPFPFRIAIGVSSGELIGVGLGTPDHRNWLLTGTPLQQMGRAQQAAPPGGVVLHASTHQCATEIAHCTPLEEPELFLVSPHQPLDVEPQTAPLPQLPEGLSAPEQTQWLLTRLDALSPYLAPELLKRLTALTALDRFRLWSEHRHVTILMIALAALPDFTVHRESPQQLEGTVAQSNALFVQIRDIIRTYDGTVNKIGIGPEDAYLMALFGAPQAHEDDPLRAVMAALELQERIDVPLQVGINTGFVFAGDVGTDARREYTVMGDAVNLAYRLMNRCEPGEVWLGPHTAQHSSVSRRVEVQPAPAQHLKGKRELITPYLAQGVRRLFAGEELESLPLVGRLATLKRFREALQRTLVGEAGVVLLHGAAGSGKSRLVRSFNEEARADGFVTYAGTAPSYGGHLPYAAWERPLRDLLRLDDFPSKAHPTILREVLAQQEQEMWAALLAPLVGLDIEPSPEVEALSPELREAQRQAVLRDLLTAHAAHQPLMLVLENAHWMPAPSLRLVESLLHEPPTGRFLLIVTYRDEDAFLARWQPPAKAVDLHLPPLSDQAMSALAQYAAGTHTLPLEVKRWILRRGEGQPLFAIEAVRALRAAGLLKREEQGWALTRPLEEAPLPETTYGLIQSRIDQLEPPSRHLLRAATIVGEQMTMSMLVEGYGEEPRSIVEQRLASLSPMGLVYGDPGHETLIFQQPLVREVARRGLPYRIRRQIHRRLSAYLDEQREHATSNWLALLAHHAFEGQQWPIAVRANLDLGHRALENYLMEQAAQAFRRVLQALKAGQIEDMRLRTEAHHLLGETLTIQGQYPEALQHLQQAHHLLSPSVTTAEIEELAHLEYHIASTLETQGEIKEAFQAVERGLALPHVKETLEGARLYLRGSSLFYKQGHYEQGKLWNNRAIEVARGIGGIEARRVQAQALYALAPLEYQQGHLEVARSLSEESLAIYRELHDLMGEVNARTNLLLVHLNLGRWDQAVEHGEQALMLARRIHYVEGEARVAANLGEVYRYQGKFDAARQAYQRALKIARDRGITFGEAVMEINLAAIALQEKNWEEAREHLTQAESLSHALGSGTLLPDIYYLHAALAHKTGNTTQALKQCEQALQIVADQGATQENGPLQRLRVEIHLALDNCPAAETALHQARSVTDSAQDPYERAHLRLIEARYLHQCDSPSRGLQRLAEARAAFERLGASGDLDTVNRLYRQWTGSSHSQKT
ncbi:MAG: tetratricopeptide repeat protein [Anaerolineae bacterium]